MLHLPRSSRAGEPLHSTNVFTIFVAMLVTLGSSILTRAQNTEGTILGTVKDPSGAVVAGATVRLKNQGVVSLSLFKHVALTERVRLEIGGAAANLFNHPNYAVPGLLDLANVGSGFGQISNLQTAEGAGPRSIQLTGRITF